MDAFERSDPILKRLLGSNILHLGGLSSIRVSMRALRSASSSFCSSSYPLRLRRFSCRIVPLGSGSSRCLGYCSARWRSLLLSIRTAPEPVRRTDHTRGTRIARHVAPLDSRNGVPYRLEKSEELNVLSSSVRLLQRPIRILGVFSCRRSPLRRSVSAPLH